MVSAAAPEEHEAEEALAEAEAAEDEEGKAAADIRAGPPTLRFTASPKLWRNLLARC